MKLGLKESIIILLIIFALAMFIIYGKSRSNNNKVTRDIKEAIIVDNSTDFYDVSGIVDKYIDALMNKNTNDIIKMLDNSYINENGISKHNLYKYVQDLSDNNYSFSPVKMYYYEINDDQYKFYVFGHLEIETIDYSTDYKDFYVCVIMDKEKNIFSIIPDDGSIFKEVEK